MVSLHFDCPTRNGTVRRALESYVGFLEKALEQYWNLLEDYVKLQEEHERCNTHPSSPIINDDPCARIKNQLTPQRQLTSNTVVQESNSPSLLELDSLHFGSMNFDSDMKTDSENKSSHNKNVAGDSPSKSPIFSRKYARTGGACAKRSIKSPNTMSLFSTDSLSDDTKTQRTVEKASPECSPRLEISTTQHVETTFLSNGKRLKQSRLIFHPVKHDERVLSLPDISKVKSIDATHETGRDPVNISTLKAPAVTKDDVTNTEETSLEDVIEISPTQSSVKSKLKHFRLKLKRKQPVKSSPDKNTCFKQKPAIVITVDDADATSMQMKSENKSLAKDSNTVGALKDKINIHDHSSAQKHNMLDVKTAMSVEAQKKDQSAISRVHSIAQNADTNFDEEETFYLPAEQAANKNDSDNFSLDNSENNPPAKRILLNKFDALPKRKEDIPEQLNMRRKADRAKLNGWDCWECEEYYKNLSLSKEELQKRKNQCSRHRYRYERPNTPEGFWNPEFPETMSCTFRPN